MSLRPKVGLSKFFDVSFPLEVSSIRTTSRHGNSGPRRLRIKRYTSGRKTKKFILLTRCSSRDCNAKRTYARYKEKERKGIIF